MIDLTPALPTDILEPIAHDMQEVDAVIRHRLTTNVPLVAEITHYIIASGGKRLRPALLLLICGTLGHTQPDRHQLAAVIELIHTATLLHDDVVDASTLRRGKKTANEAFGNPASVLVGDFLHTRSFQMMVECGNLQILEILSNATNVIAEGEVMQLINMHDAQLQQEEYIDVIRSKTAKLFEASALIGAVLAGADDRIRNACSLYGRSLGTAFQIIDDVLDYDGDAQRMGKNLGDDLREGKTTLPLIFAMQRGTAQDAKLIQEAIQIGETAELAKIIQIVRSTGSLESAKQVAYAEALCAKNALLSLPRNAYSETLDKLASNLLERES